MSKLLILDREVSKEMIAKRKKLGLDRYDEVWEGVYVMPSTPSSVHQRIVSLLVMIFSEIVVMRELGDVFGGLNVSDQRKRWKWNYRVPDVVVVLNEGIAKVLENHVYGGPDFLVEVRSPQEDPEEKIPFYSEIKVRELLCIDRDTREVKLYRHNGVELVLVEPTIWNRGSWFISDVMPVAFRACKRNGNPKLEIRRTDDNTKKWAV